MSEYEGDSCKSWTKHLFIWTRTYYCVFTFACALCYSFVDNMEECKLWCVFWSVSSLFMAFEFMLKGCPPPRGIVTLQFRPCEVSCTFRVSFISCMAKYGHNYDVISDLISPSHRLAMGSKNSIATWNMAQSFAKIWRTCFLKGTWLLHTSTLVMRIEW